MNPSGTMGNNFPLVYFGDVDQNVLYRENHEQSEVDIRLPPDEYVRLPPDEYVRRPIEEGVPTTVVVAGSYNSSRYPRPRLFVIPTMWVKLKNRLEKNMAHFFSANEAEEPAKLSSGNSYVVFFKGVWNRVFFMHFTGSDEAKLIFYDEGIVRTMPVYRVKHLPPQFLEFGSLVIEICIRQEHPALCRGDLVSLAFRYLLQPDLWVVNFVGGPTKMINSLAYWAEKWVLQSYRLFPSMPRSLTSDLTRASMADEFQLPPPGVIFPVKVLRDSGEHIIVTPVAWLNEMQNMINALPSLVENHKYFPYKLIGLGSCCAVPYVGGWFRARIRSVDRSVRQMAMKVRLIDLGLILHVDRTAVRTLPRHLLPAYKKPLCFPVKKTKGVAELLPVGEFRFIALNNRAQDNSWLLLDPPEPCYNISASLTLEILR